MITMVEREDTFAGVGGVDIFWRAWMPERPERPPVVISHGVSEHAMRYAHVAERLVEQGFPVYAPDHRGHGRSGGRRAYLDRFAHTATDLDRVVDIAAAEHGAKPVLIGHSMGGCIATFYALEFQHKLEVLVLSAPLVTLAAATPQQRAAGRILSRVAPWLPLFPVDANLVSRDPEEVRKYVEDPLNYHGRLPARTIDELASTIDGFPERIPLLKLPLLVMHGTDDQIVPVEAGKMIHNLASSEDKTLLLYEGFFHEIFNEYEADRQRVLDDMLGWLGTRV